jgi:hypothetical protein
VQRHHFCIAVRNLDSDKGPARNRSLDTDRFCRECQGKVISERGPG